MKGNGFAPHEECPLERKLKQHLAERAIELAKNTPYEELVKAWINLDKQIYYVLGKEK